MGHSLQNRPQKLDDSHLSLYLIMKILLRKIRILQFNANNSEKSLNLKKQHSQKFRQIGNQTLIIRQRLLHNFLTFGFV
jgi:hypothetical protein